MILIDAPRQAAEDVFPWEELTWRVAVLMEEALTTSVLGEPYK